MGCKAQYRIATSPAKIKFTANVPVPCKAALHFATDLGHACRQRQITLQS